MKMLLSILVLVFSFSALAIQNPDAASQVSEMHSYQLNGFELSGAEYWVYVAGKDFKYPDDVLWDFDAAGAPDSAKACALQAYNKLNQFLTNPPEKLLRLKAKGTTVRFYLWTNDYSAAAADLQEDAAEFWHWNRGPKNYSQGYWKWMSTVTHDGKCTIPNDQQIDQRMDEILKILGE